MGSTFQATDIADLPSPPFIDVAGIPNFRDLGGYPLSDKPNLSVRKGAVYRCGLPSHVTEDGIATIQKLGVTHIYDLRSSDEVERNKATELGGLAEWEGCTRVFVPVYTQKDEKPESVSARYKNYTSDAEGFVRAYTEILKIGHPAYRKILLHLANEPSKPLIIHCSAGKDRTGVICAVILSLCGVEDEIVAKEYSLTDIGLGPKWKAAVVQYLMKDPGLKDNEEGAWTMLSSKIESMRLTLKVLEDQFGGAENYAIEKCGLTKEEVERIRSNLIVAEPLIHA